MKRSGTMGLVLMGTAAFAATFAGGAAYMHLSTPAGVAQAANCKPRADGACEPQARRGGFAFIPAFFGWRSASSTTRGGFGATALFSRRSAGG